MALVNALLDRFFDLLLTPLGPLPVLVSLAIVSLLTAIATLPVIRATSDERALTATKRQMYADLLEMRLFRNDIGGMWRAQWSLFQHNLGYVRLSLGAALVILVPLALTVAQLQCFFGYSSVAVGEPVLVTAVLMSSDEPQHITLDLPSGTHLDTSAIWFPALKQIVWRVVADSNGEYVLGVRVGEMIYGKTFCVSNEIARRSPVRTGAGLIERALYPSEAPLPDSAPIVSIAVGYPERRLEAFGADMSWLNAYIVLSIVFALALKRPLARVLPAR